MVDCVVRLGSDVGRRKLREISLFNARHSANATITGGDPAKVGSETTQPLPSQRMSTATFSNQHGAAGSLAKLTTISWRLGMRVSVPPKRATSSRSESGFQDPVRLSGHLASAPRNLPPPANALERRILRLNREDSGEGDLAIHFREVVIRDAEGIFA
jgi:hypothetical protein